MSMIQELAERAVSGVDMAMEEGGHVERMDPVIITIFTTVIDGLIRCRKAKNGDDAATAQASMLNEISEHRHTSRNSVAARVKRTAKTDHKIRLRRTEALAYASKLLSQAEETSAEDFAAAYAEVA